MDYKHTLNLPRTDFPMKADLVTREPQRLARWQASRLYEQIQAAGGTVEFYEYPGDDHNLSNYFSLAMRRSLEFFDRYVKGG